MPNGTVTLIWDNGEDTFCLGKIEHLLDLEGKCDAGIFEIAGRLESSIMASAGGQLAGRARVNDVRETIRLGLVGGGMPAEKAMAAIKLHVDTRPLLTNAMLAYEIIAAVLRGVAGDHVGKEAADRAKEQGSGSTIQGAGLSDPQSTGSAPQ